MVTNPGVAYIYIDVAFRTDLEKSETHIISIHDIDQDLM